MLNKCGTIHWDQVLNRASEFYIKWNRDWGRTNEHTHPHTCINYNGNSLFQKSEWGWSASGNCYKITKENEEEYLAG